MKIKFFFDIFKMLDLNTKVVNLKQMFGGCSSWDEQNSPTEIVWHQMDEAIFHD